MIRQNCGIPLAIGVALVWIFVPRIVWAQDGVTDTEKNDVVESSPITEHNEALRSAGDGLERGLPPTNVPPDIEIASRTGENHNIIAGALFWGGLATVAAGGVLGALTVSTRATMRDGASRSYEDVQALYDRAHTLGLAADAMLGAGAALVAIGAIMWLTGVGEMAGEQDSTISYLPISGGGGFAISASW
jgi:hypothetical protein